MANHIKFNKIVKKLDDRQFKCKTFYDSYWNLIMNNKREVYLKEEVDAVLKNLKEMYDEQEDEIIRLKKKADDFMLENYQLKKRKKKK
jgi:hypothetical protein